MMHKSVSAELLSIEPLFCRALLHFQFAASKVFVQESVQVSGNLTHFLWVSDECSLFEFYFMFFSLNFPD